MKKNELINEIEKRRKNIRFFKLVDSIPYNNSKVGQTFIMKGSSINKSISADEKKIKPRRFKLKFLKRKIN